MLLQALVNPDFLLLFILLICVFGDFALLKRGDPWLLDVGVEPFD